MRVLSRVAILAFGLLLSIAPAASGPSMLVDAESGLVLYAEDADYPWQPASLTKLMTGYLAFEAIRDGKLSPDDTLVCSANAMAQEPSKLGLPVGAELRVETALKALIIKSANDVAVMLGERIAGDEAAFVERMNATAKRLGMTSTRFVNPSGLPVRSADKQPPPHAVTTARDMAVLARALFREFPEYAELYEMPSFKLGKRVLRSHNSLLRTYEGADGMKTGFVCASGYNVVASASRDGRRLIAVVLGESSGGARTLRAASLFEHGFEIYPWKTVFSPTLTTLPVSTPDGAEAPDLRPIVCRPAAPRARRKKKKRLPKKKAVTAAKAPAKKAP